MHRWCLVAALLAGTFVIAPCAQAVCSRAYSYAGLVDGRAANGVRASLTALEPPAVEWGHVAGWVGVGGPGAGPNGTSEWVQAGYSGFYGGDTALYVEVKRPHRSPRYREVLAGIPTGATHRVAVVELRTAHNWWHVRVDGRSVSRPVYLPGSHAAWAPVATTESWNAGTDACNGFAYRFARVAVRRAGEWRGLYRPLELEDPGYRVDRLPTGFVGARAR